jgi:autophagy-related protein 101
MTTSPPHSYTLDIFSDQHLVRDLSKGILHTIFFHRYFPSIRPSLYTPTPSSSSAPRASSTSGVEATLPIPLPCILDPPEIAAAIDASVAELMAQLNTPSGPGNVPPGGTRGQIVVQFFERKRRKTGYTGGWLGRLGGGGVQTDEEVCWEEWCLKVVVARPRSEAGELSRETALWYMVWNALLILGWEQIVSRCGERWSQVCRRQR